MSSSRKHKKGSFSAEGDVSAPLLRQKSVAQAIARWLMKNGEYPRTTKEIINGTGLKSRSVQRHLENMVIHGVIRSPVRGCYSLAMGSPDITNDPDGRLGLHGIVLKGPNWRETPQGSPVGRVQGWKPAKKENHLLVAYEEFEGRTVRFHYHTHTRTLNIYINASRKPLAFEEFKDLRTWLKTMLHPVDPDLRTYLVQVGINKDYWNWRLDGVKGVRMKIWNNAYEALYQKGPRTVRHERHLTLTECTLLDAMKHIDGNSPTRLMLEAVSKIAEREGEKDKAKPKTPEPGYGGYQSGYS